MTLPEPAPALALFPDFPSSNLIWNFKAKSLYVVDGDTIDLEIDQGMHTVRLERVRLLGVNCPETHGPRAVPAGQVAKQFTASWLAQADKSAEDTTAWPLVILTHKDPDAFGRYLAIIYNACNGSCLNQALLDSHNAIPFMLETLRKV